LATVTAEQRLHLTAAQRRLEPAPSVSSKTSAKANRMMEQLKELIKMRNDGDIDPDEFKAMKAALIRE
jgi:hypothetical protein